MAVDGSAAQAEGNLDEDRADDEEEHDGQDDHVERAQDDEDARHETDQAAPPSGRHQRARRGPRSRDQRSGQAVSPTAEPSATAPSSWAPASPTGETVMKMTTTNAQATSAAPPRTRVMVRSRADTGRSVAATLHAAAGQMRRIRAPVAGREARGGVERAGADAGRGARHLRCAPGPAARRSA